MKGKRGFTLIEVALFLALTAVLFVGIAIGTQNSIFQQRYNDSVQSFVEFLRNAYAQTLNVQSEGRGMSDKAIYGKLVTFNVNGEKGNIINTYDVIGKATYNGGSGSALEILKNLEADVFTKDNDGNYKAVGFVEEYKPKWGSAIQFDDAAEDPKASFVGALLIIRHPLSGTVYTYVTKATINVEEALGELSEGKSILGEYLELEEGDSNAFKIKQVDFCVNPNGPGEGGSRRDVRVVKGARNASGIEIVSDSNSECKRL